MWSSPESSALRAGRDPLQKSGYGARVFEAWRRRWRAWRGENPPKERSDPGPERAPQITVETLRRARALQRAYWTPDATAAAQEAEELDALGLEALSWRELLRLHHLWTLRALPEGGVAALLEGAPMAPPDAKARALLDALASAASPYRPRHGFMWLGEGPPEGEDIPYSDHQGRLANAALTHLGALEVVTLDAQLEPLAVDFLPFDEIMTLACTGAPGFRSARLLPEYGAPERFVLIAGVYGSTWTLPQAESQASTSARMHAPWPHALPSPWKGGAHRIGLGMQAWARQSDYVEEGLALVTLADAYQISLAIEQDDPRFVDKCRGRGLDPEATRADAQAEAARRKPKLRLRTLD